MTIDRIKINAFGCHRDLELHFTKGVNLIYGNNESGKSTLLAFVRAVLYGFDSRASDNPRKKYMPWGSGPDTRFGGELTFTHEEKHYRAVALFTQSKRTDMITLYNDVTGTVIVIPDGQSIGEFILGLTASAFDCSVFAAQLKSRGDFSRDKSGLLITRLSAASNNTAESSHAEAEHRLKDAMQRISAPRKGDGILDKLLQKQAALKEALSHIEDREGRVGDLSNDLETLSAKEAKLDSRRKYYMQFYEIKQAFSTLELRSVIKRKHKELTQISAEIEDIKEPIDTDLYDLPEHTSKVFLLFAVLLMLVFGAGLFFSTFAVLKSMTLGIVAGSFAGTLLALCGSIICILKSKKTLTFQSVPEDDVQRLEELEDQLHKEQKDFDALLGGLTLEEYEQRWEKAAELIQSAELNKSTLLSIQRCSADMLSEKLKTATAELMEIRNQISYTKACIDTLQYSGGQNQAADDIFSSDDIYSTLQEIETKITSYQNKLEALSLARKILAQSSEELQTTFGPVINMRTQSYLEAITGLKHGDLRISGDFDVSVYDSTNMVCHVSGDYSGATEDQMYLALRCALLSLISPDGSPLPLYLDDPFVQYDDKRFAMAAEFIGHFTVNTGTQVILATCQSRSANGFPDCNTIYLKGAVR